MVGIRIRTQNRLCEGNLAASKSRIDAKSRDLHLGVFCDYISIYDIQCAVADEATKPINYESRIAKLALNAAELPKLDAVRSAISLWFELSRRLSAPPGHHAIAQGNALGSIIRKNIRPEGAAWCDSAALRRCSWRGSDHSITILTPRDASDRGLVRDRRGTPRPLRHRRLFCLAPFSGRGGS